MKVGIIGSGLVGSTAAYALVMKGIGREIVLVDKDRKRCEAEARDLMHATPFAHALRIAAGGYEDLKDAKIVLLAAGAAQEPGQSRLDLVAKNAGIFREILPRAISNAPDAVFLVATNPVDAMTQLTAEHLEAAGKPKSRALGSGTTLDTARFRALLGERIGVDPQHVHAYVIGEHGDSEVLPWSLVTIAGVPLEDFCRYRSIALCDEEKEEIERDVRNSAYSIIDGKGATCYGIGSALARIVDAVLKDRRSILTVSHPSQGLVDGEEVSVSLPRLLGGNGVSATFQVTLEEPERRALRESARKVHEAAGPIRRHRSPERGRI